MKEIDKRFQELLKKVKSDEFYYNKGLANEVPFYIFDYSPKEELLVRDYVKNTLLPSLKSEDRLQVVEIDLFELLLESMKNDDILDSSFLMEEKKGTKFLYEKLKKSFHIGIILEYIQEKSEGKNFVILTFI